jgi:hypothetical protein
VEPKRTKAVILVEGPSDARAVEVLAERQGRDLIAADVEVVAIGGITNLGHFLRRLTPTGVRITGLYDAAEDRYVRRLVARRDHTVELFACHADLEDELIRALGIPAVVDVITSAGDLDSWLLLRRQPFHRERPEGEVLRRFFGTTSGRKLRYAGLLTTAVDLEQVPEPLDKVLTAALREI